MDLLCHQSHHSKGLLMNTTTPTPTPVTSAGPRRNASLRPWWPWLLTAAAFPPSGLIAHTVVGRVNSLPAAVFAGAIAGASIGTAQWALLRRRGMTVRWIVATAAGLSLGLALGASV